MTLLSLVAVSAAAPLAGRARGVCHVPRLPGLTLEAARHRVAHAGCRLRVKGAPIERAGVQTVARQSPAAGRRSSSVTVWLNPLCRGGAAYGPGIKEPLVTNGPTELISGFYLVGGPLAKFSGPQCKRPEPLPGAGIVEAIDASGALVATKAPTRGHFAELPLPAGSYTIRATFLDATINGVHPKQAESVVAPAGHTVRQDFFLSIP